MIERVIALHLLIPAVARSARLQLTDVRHHRKLGRLIRLDVGRQSMQLVHAVVSGDRHHFAQLPSVAPHLHARRLQLTQVALAGRTARVLQEHPLRLLQLQRPCTNKS